jgi:hypothetical protein
MATRLNGWWLLGALALSLGPLGCYEDTTGNGDSQAQATGMARQDHPFNGRLLEIAGSYESYWVPSPALTGSVVLCEKNFDLIRPQDSRTVRLSAAGDSSPHGMKLYLLFTEPPLSDPGVEPPTGKWPVGQVVVKEAWLPEEAEDVGQPLPAVPRKLHVRRGDGWAEEEDRFVPYGRHGDKLYHAREKAGLFIMFKLVPGTPGTDEGWVYGTVTPDGKQVTGAGRLESCMNCHQDAPHDRLFGPAKH